MAMSGEVSGNFDPGIWVSWIARTS